MLRDERWFATALTKKQIGKTYEDGMRRIIDRMKAAGATVVVGSPGVVDSFTWNRNNPDFDQVYNDNLEHLGQIAEQLAKENKFPHADVFGAMKQAMVAAKSALGEEYPVAGRDGVHPGPNGHLVMAYAFLKSLGLDGDIGTVTVDLRDRQSKSHRRSQSAEQQERNGRDRKQTISVLFLWRREGSQWNRQHFALRTVQSGPEPFPTEGPESTDRSGRRDVRVHNQDFQQRPADDRHQPGW